MLKKKKTDVYKRQLLNRRCAPAMMWTKRRFPLPRLRLCAPETPVSKSVWIWMWTVSYTHLERSLLATKFWNLYHDLSEDAREAGYLSCLSEIKGNGFPEETRRLTCLLYTSRCV